MSKRRDPNQSQNWQCAKCEGSTVHNVISTSSNDGKIWRQVQCSECSGRQLTVEISEYQLALYESFYTRLVELERSVSASVKSAKQDKLKIRQYRD